jgi:hypothetical protein
MSKELDFIQTCLSIHPSQLVENIASGSHETRRIPDPYIFLIKDIKLLTPNGVVIEENIRNDSFLDSIELKAFLAIQDWAENNGQGTAFWFSPPFPGKYDKGKVVVSQILHNYDEQKILFNRNIVLDVDTKTILSIANNISGKTGSDLITDPELLRQTPFFSEHNQLEVLLNEISAYTDQGQMVEKGIDIDSKNITYGKLLLIEKMSRFMYANTSDSQYLYAHRIAEEQGLIGKHIGSCGQGTKLSAFEVFSEGGTQEKWDYHSGVCRVCGNSTDVGPCNICRTCEKKF